MGVLKRALSRTFIHSTCLGLVEALLLRPGVVEPHLDPVLHRRRHFVPVHVGRHVVELLLEAELALARVEHDVPDVADEDGEDEDADEPRGRHEEQLEFVVGRRLLVLADRRGSLGGEVEAVQVCRALWLIKDSEV